MRKALDLNRVPQARKSPLPRFIAPQLATLVKEAPPGDDWLHELKFDGYRMICRLDRGSVRFWSRNGNDWSDKFPNLSKALALIPVESAMLDGEVVVQDERGRTSFQKLQHAIGKGDAGFIYEVFDLMHLNGFDLTETPLETRKELLGALLNSKAERPRVRFSEHVRGNGPLFFEHACKHGVEGIVSKRASSRYESTRSRNWLKIKCGRRQEFVIAGYTPSERGLPGFGSLVLGVYEGGNLVYAGRVGTGFSLKQRVELKETLDKIASSACPFEGLPSGLRGSRWVTPALVAEVAFAEWTSDGVIRHPSFQGLRGDKNPREVRRESPD